MPGINPPVLLIGHKFQTLFEGSTVLGVFENLPSVTEKNITLPKDFFANLLH